jgi:hypothetical protein
MHLWSIVNTLDLTYKMKHFFDFSSQEFPKSTTFFESSRVAELSVAGARSQANAQPKSRSWCSAVTTSVSLASDKNAPPPSPSVTYTDYSFFFIAFKPFAHSSHLHDKYENVSSVKWHFSYEVWPILSLLWEWQSQYSTVQYSTARYSTLQYVTTYPISFIFRMHQVFDRLEEILYEWNRFSLYDSWSHLVQSLGMLWIWC